MILKTNNMNIQKRFSVYITCILLVLLLPLIAMQYTDEINWQLTDFIVAGVLLILTSIAIETSLRLFSNKNHKTIFIVIILFVLLLLWAEMAVGIFGSPIAGS